ncbi:hypothetical protein R1T08_03280 [Streptomyces sp. SBC-4]|nr:hypothetical protein [Streptomyces sp. SBC-4]MDV5143348.1 hypothetical protein [Streptomyces sp. SBC-4]
MRPRRHRPHHRLAERAHRRRCPRPARHRSARRDRPACPNTDVSKGQAPCVKVTAVSVGASRLLKVRGTPVALATAKGTTQAVPVLPFAWQVEDPGQTLLRTD